MNTIYRIVWNKALGEWTAVSELAKGKGRKVSESAGTSHGLRRMALAIACVLGGSMACVPAVHAGPAAGQGASMQGGSSRLADLNDLLSKYGSAQPAVAKRAAPSTVAVGPRQQVRQPDPVSQPEAMATSAHVRVAVQQPKASLNLAESRSTATPSSVHRATHVTASRTQSSQPVSAERIRSPQLASNAQISAMLQQRGQTSSHAAAVPTRHVANTWVVGKDGSLHVDASTTGSAAIAHVTSATAHDRTTANPVPRHAALPSVQPGVAAISVTPNGGLAQVDASHGAIERVRVARVDATPSLPPVPAMTSSQPLVSLVPSDGSLLVGAKAHVAQVGLTHGVGQMHVRTPSLRTQTRAHVQVASAAAAPSTTVSLSAGSVHDAALLASLGSVRYNLAGESATPAGSTTPAATSVPSGNVTVASAATDQFSVPMDDSGMGTASAGSPTLYAPMRASAMMTPRMAVAPMAAAADTVGVPTVPEPGDTPTGLIVSNGGVAGTVSTLLGTSLNDLFKNANPEGYVNSGGLKVSNANFTQGYGVVNVLGIPTVNTTPVGGLLTDTDGAVVGGTGINSHLTLIGAVTSGNYIKNINNGAAGGLLGLVLPDDAPAWASTCADLLGLGLVTQDCWGVNAAQDYQVLMGDGATANGSKEVVIGTGASHKLPTQNADDVFPGDGRNDADNPSGVPTADYEARLGHSVVIGDEASGTANGQTLIGAEATSDQPNSVALGYKSNADRGPNMGYTNAFGLAGVAQNSVGEVAVGSAGNARQITHVAAGTEDHDAVNVAQLKGAVANAGAGKLAVKYDADANGDPTNKVTLIGDGTGAPVAITNVAPGAVTPTSTDAVNGSQLSSTNTTVAQYFGGTTNYDGTTNTWTPPDFEITNIDNSGNVTTGNYNNVDSAFDALNTSLTNIYNNGVKYFHANSTLDDGSASGTNSIAVGPLAEASAEDTIAIGNGAKADKAGSIALGAGSATTVGAQTDYTAYALKAKQTSDGEVNVGNRKITGVAAGSNANDAVNVAQLKAVSGSVDDLSDLAVKYDADANGKPTNHISLVGDGTGAPVGISQLAAGTLSAGSTDAVNGAQLFGTNTMIASFFGGTTAFDGATNTWTPPDFSIANIDAEGNVTTGHYDNVTAAFDALNASLLNVNNNNGGGGSSKYFKANSTGAAADASGTESVAMGGDTVAAGTGTVAAGSGAHAETDGSVAIGHNATADGGQAVAIGPNAQASGDGAVSIGDPNVATGTGVVALGKDNTATGTGSVALGNESKATGTGVVAMGNKSEATADGAVAIGNGASSAVKNGVAIGTDSVADRANTVSVGSAGNERQITNVAAGTSDTDAVNVAQLKASSKGTVKYDTYNNGTTNYKNITLGKPGGGGGTTTIHNVGPGKADHDAVNVAQLRGVKNWAKSYTDQRVNHFMRELNQVGDNAYAGVAAAMAMAGLPQAYLPGKNMAAIAGGTFHGESSLAIGVSMISDNGRWVFKLSGSDNTQGDAGASVGVGIQW